MALPEQDKLNKLLTIGDLSKYPSVQWKLLNLAKLKKQNSSKLQVEVDKLREILEK